VALATASARALASRPTLALRLALGRLGRLLRARGRAAVRRSLDGKRDLLALLADHRHRLADRDLASWTAIFSSTPDASASTSCVTLSVSSS
jgi:hypothetical protein